MHFLATSAVVVAAASSVLAVPLVPRNGGSSQGPPPGSTCSSGSNFCKNGGQWSSNTQDCSTGDVYCCSSTGGLLDALNCVNALNGNSVTVDIGDLLGSGPVVSRRNGGGSGQGPPPGSTCSSGSNFCKNSGGWSSNTQDCSTGDVYCCSSSGGINALNCLNLLNGNTIDVDASDLLGGLGLLRRNGGSSGGSPPPSNTCDSGSNFCKNGGSWSSNWQDCSTGDVYCCSSTGGVNALNCVNALNGNSIDVQVGDLLGGLGLLRRNGGSNGGSWPPPTNTCDSGSNFCKNGGSWSSNWQDCSTGDVYCCSSKGGLLNAANCVNALNGNSVDVELGDLF